jgi:hypothetical protein
MAPLDLGRDPRWVLDIFIFGALATAFVVGIVSFQIQVSSSVRRKLIDQSQAVLGRELDGRAYAPVWLALANEEVLAEVLKGGIAEESLRMQYEATLSQAREKSRFVISNYLLAVSGWTNHPKDAADAVLDRFAVKFASIAPSDQRPWQVWTQHVRMTLAGRPLTGSEIRSDFLQALTTGVSVTRESP